MISVLTTLLLKTEPDDLTAELGILLLKCSEFNRCLAKFDKCWNELCKCSRVRTVVIIYLYLLYRIARDLLTVAPSTNVTWKPIFRLIELILYSGSHCSDQFKAARKNNLEKHRCSTAMLNSWFQIQHGTINNPSCCSRLADDQLQNKEGRKRRHEEREKACNLASRPANLPASLILRVFTSTQKFYEPMSS